VEILLDYMKDPRTLLNIKERSDTKVGPQLDLEISVPVASQAWGQGYMEYAIAVLYNYQKWTIKRRYSQLKEFYAKAQKVLEDMKIQLKDPLPPMPKTRLFESHTTDPEVCKERATQFQVILKFLTQPALHENFCKSQLFRDFLEIGQHTKSEPSQSVAEASSPTSKS